MFIFFETNDYLKFCNNMKYYISQEVKFASLKKDKNYQNLERYWRLSDWKTCRL